MSAADDPVLSRFREQISETDRAIVEAMNRRVRLVGEIKAYKDSRGIDFVDPEREESMLRDLTGENAGPLSAESLRELFQTVLDLSKREVTEG